MSSARQSSSTFAHYMKRNKGHTCQSKWKKMLCHCCCSPGTRIRADRHRIHITYVSLKRLSSLFDCAHLPDADSVICALAHDVPSFIWADRHWMEPISASLKRLSNSFAWPHSPGADGVVLTPAHNVSTIIGVNCHRNRIASFKQLSDLFASPHLPNAETVSTTLPFTIYLASSGLIATERTIPVRPSSGSPLCRKTAVKHTHTHHSIMKLQDYEINSPGIWDVMNMESLRKMNNSPRVSHAIITQGVCKWGKSDKLQKTIRPECFDVSQDERLTRKNSLDIFDEM